MLNDFFILMKMELLVTVIIFLLLLVKLGKGISNDVLLPIIQVGLLLNFLAGFFLNKEGILFDGMFYTTPLAVVQKSILNLGVYLISLLFADWFRRCENLAEFFVLMLSALLGMFFMISSGNLLIFYLALELSTIPIAAVVNFDLRMKKSSEASMKMILSSAFSSGILLFGISLIYGITGSIQFAELSVIVTQSPLQILAFIFFFTAFAFKLSIVPFHLWTADVYEGSPVAVTAFLSVISKGAVAFIFLTVLYRVFHSLNYTWYHLLVALSVITMITGNLFAIRQDNFKRFLAFSSIAQVGFILVGVSADSVAGQTSVVYFILVYLFSNLGAFGVISAICANTGKEKISELKGLYKNNPFLTWVLALSLFSLAGIPPTAGFFGKLFLITAGASRADYWFIIVAALNMIISLYYYLIVIKTIFSKADDQSVQKIQLLPSVKLGLMICAAAVILTGLMSWVYDYIAALK